MLFWVENYIFSVDLFILANNLKNDVYLFFNHDISRNP
jgi:hypothetical protein